MQARKAKFIIIALLGVFVFFFSSDFGLIDVEKTSIITAIAIDKYDKDVIITAQIAVPEATDTNSENLKAQISGKGSTVGGAIKNLGDFSGWFPKLAFCNLIIIGNDFSSENVIGLLDYFAKTLRVQDSALVALADGKASELLNLSTPLDNISAFALQKIMLKNTGFDKDVSSTDIKTFCVGHYSISHSAFMPIIKPTKASGDTSTPASSSTSGGGGQNGGQAKEGKNLFDASTTALFLDGKMVAILDSDMTLAFNAITTKFNGTTLSADDVLYNGQKTNYLLTVMSNDSNISVTADEYGVNVKIDLNLFCKVSDHRANDSDQSLSQNKPVPKPVKDKIEEFFTSQIQKLIETEIQSGCDFLKIKEKLYRYNFKQYSIYKDNYLSKLSSFVSVKVKGPN